MEMVFLCLASRPPQVCIPCHSDSVAWILRQPVAGRPWRKSLGSLFGALEALVTHLWVPPTAVCMQQRNDGKTSAAQCGDDTNRPASASQQQPALKHFSPPSLDLGSHAFWSGAGMTKISTLQPRPMPNTRHLLTRV